MYSRFSFPNTIYSIISSQNSWLSGSEAHFLGGPVCLSPWYCIIYSRFGQQLLLHAFLSSFVIIWRNNCALRFVFLALSLGLLETWVSVHMSQACPAVHLLSAWKLMVWLRFNFFCKGESDLWLHIVKWGDWCSLDVIKSQIRFCCDHRSISSLV